MNMIVTLFYFFIFLFFLGFDFLSVLLGHSICSSPWKLFKSGCLMFGETF